MAYINGTEILFSPIINIGDIVSPEEPDTNEPAQLATPVVSISSSGRATWQSVKNAKEYCYKIYDGIYLVSTETTPERFATLESGQTILVKAVADGVNYSDSDFSEAQTYNEEQEEPDTNEPIKLSTPIVTVNSDGWASWESVENAVGYRYIIYSSVDDLKSYTNNGAGVVVSAVALNLGQKIQVQAFADGVNYSNSDLSEAVTYNISSIFYGVGTVTGAEDDPFTSSFIKGLTGISRQSRNCSFTVSPQSQYIYFAAIKDYCIDGNGNDVAVFTVNNFSGGFLAPQTLNIGGVDYYIYRSAQKLTGDITVNVT